MYSFLKLKSLTTVAIVLGTLWAAPMAWGQAECNEKERRDTYYKAEIDLNKKFSGKKTDDTDYANAKDDLAKKKAEWEDCKNKKDSQCTDLNARYKDLIKDYSYKTRQKAEDCLDLNEDNDSGFTVALMQAFGGVHENPLDGRSECNFGKKDNFDDQMKEKVKQIDEYEKDIRKAEEDLVKSQKKLTEEVNELQEARQELKEKWEEAQQDSQNAMEKALSQMRDNQISIQNQIRKIQTELLTGRQNLNKVQSNMKAELAKQGLQSEASIDRICQNQARDYYDKRYAPSKGKKASSASKAASRGKKKTSDLQALYKDCLKSAYERRASVYQTFEDHAAQLAKHIQNLEEQLVELENQYTQQVKDYNTALEKNESQLKQAQQRYFEKDNQLANQIMQAQQNGQLESTRLQQNKMKDQRRLMGAINSQGGIKRSQAEEIINKNDTLNDVIAQGKGLACSVFEHIDETGEINIQKAREKRDSRTSR